MRHRIEIQKYFHSSQDTASGPKVTESGRHDVEVGQFRTFCRRDPRLKRVASAGKSSSKDTFYVFEMISYGLNQWTVLSPFRRWMQSWKSILPKTRRTFQTSLVKIELVTMDRFLGGIFSRLVRLTPRVQLCILEFYN